jgi:hypothetical protein
MVKFCQEQFLVIKNLQKDIWKKLNKQDACLNVILLLSLILILNRFALRYRIDFLILKLTTFAR